MTTSTAPWLIVAGDLTPLGGMDAANHALAHHLGRRGAEVHVVAHRVWPDLRDLPSLAVHDVWRPFGRHLLGSPFLARAGQRVGRQLRRRHARAVVNGGNCRMAGANWVHYVHAAFTPKSAGNLRQQTKVTLAYQRDVSAERSALHDASIVICNSERTRRDVIERVGVPESRAVVVYYGTHPDRFGAIASDVRTAARQRLNRPEDRPLVGFVGALGDRRKAFDTLFATWVNLCRRSDWDADLVVVGSGAELEAWRQRAETAGIGRRVTFLGFRDDVPQILAALDCLVHPARYEAYGLSAHEALCRGLPTLVSASAGVAERYPQHLSDLLIVNPDDEEELSERLRRWRASSDRYQLACRAFGEVLRARTWEAMSEDIVTLVEQAA